MTTFKPSIDWSHEVYNTAVWVVQMFALATVCLLLVLIVIGWFTEWGRQFWRVSGDYFKGR